VSLVFALSVVLAPGAAFAETITPIKPIPPINVLPSTVNAAFPVMGGTARQNAMATMIYKFSQTNLFWSAVKSQAAGTATPSQIATITSVKNARSIPATKFASVLGKVGTAATVMTSAQIGIQIGGALSPVLGLDTEGLVCAPANGAAVGFLSLLSGTDCGNFNTITPEFTKNADAIAGTVFDTICTAGNDWCIQFKTYAAYGGGTSMWCWVGSGISGAANPSGYSFNVLTSNAGAAPVYTGSHILSDSGARKAPCKAADASTNLFSGQYSDPYSVVGYRLVQAGTGAIVEGTSTTTSGNPVRQWRCDLSSLSGGSYSSLSQEFTQEDENIPNPRCPQLPEGEILGNSKIWLVTEGLPDELVSDEDSTEEYRHESQNFPECAGATCALELIKNDTLSCLDNPQSCLDWFEDPAKETVYTCRYGGSAVSLSECTVYAPAFRPSSQLTGETLGDPATGDPLKAPAGSSNPGVDSGAFGRPVLDPASNRKCYPEGWAALNPLEWVMKPVQCALEWAFVPRATKIDNATQRLQTSWSSTTPAKVVASIATVIPALENLSDGGCGGLTVDLSGIAPNILDDPSGTLLAACPGDFFHPWAPWIKAFLVISISVSGFFAIKAQISRFVSNGEA
tara:strand:+ start:2883 stop:4760 length:1878 start_codon:yes stop_codon:yes gene_type:complete